MKESIDFLCSNTIMNIFYILISVKEKTRSEEDYSRMERLYEMLCEYVLEDEESFNER
jgi:hypothetical protein